MKNDRQAAPAEKIRAHILILEARFYGDLCDELCQGAIAAIERAGATWERIAVPGALELPGAIAMARRALACMTAMWRWAACCAARPRITISSPTKARAASWT